LAFEEEEEPEAAFEEPTDDLLFSKNPLPFESVLLKNIDTKHRPSYLRSIFS